MEVFNLTYINVMCVCVCVYVCVCVCFYLKRFIHNTPVLTTYDNFLIIVICKLFCNNFN